MSLDPQKQRAGRIGGPAVHARYGSDLIAARARRGFLAKFEREVDPDGVLTDEERLKRAQQARRAYMRRLALRSRVARSKRNLDQL